ncbi:MAG: MFS transporter permease [Desulfobacterales bacterium]
MSADSETIRSAPTEIVIPKENAVFRLDANGCWHNESGRFRNKKIIDFFHASIRKDAGGYFLFQNKGNCTEKVYFPYDDTALFVFEVILSDHPITLVLNTGERLPLEPQKLYAQNDALYVTVGEHRVKFTERSLMTISGLMTFEDENYFIRQAGQRYQISKR